MQKSISKITSVPPLLPGTQISVYPNSNSYHTGLYPWIDAYRCNGCGACVRACPPEVIGLVKKKADKDYIDAFGWEVAYRYVDEPEKIRVTGFMVGPTAIEIMEDLDGTGEVAEFIRRAGEGVMIVSYNVDNCEKSLELLKRNKARLIDQKPRWFAAYKRNFAFIHPAAMHGVLTEIIDGKYQCQLKFIRLIIKTYLRNYCSLNLDKQHW